MRQKNANQTKSTVKKERVINYQIKTKCKNSSKKIDEQILALADVIAELIISGIP